MSKPREKHAAFGDITEWIPHLMKIHYVLIETKQPIFNHTPTREDIINWKS